MVLWNDAAERITGVPSEEALGRSIPEVLQRELRSETGAVTGDRLVPIRRGDEEVWLSLTEAVMRDPAGETAGRIFAFRDISAERAVEQMRSDFVSTVSHELRAPLTSIYGFAATLMREDVRFEEEERNVPSCGYIESEARAADDDRGQAAERGAARHGGSPAGDLARRRALARLRGHRHRPQGGRQRARARSPSCRSRRSRRAPIPRSCARSSPAWSTTPSVSRRTAARSRSGARRRGETIVLSVVDQGIGIPDGEQERIFSKFYRVGDAQTGGTGVGLFIAQGLMSVLGGRITVHSQEGRGSSFVVELPASDEFASGWVDEHVTPRVLVVDDEAPIRLLCRVNLEAEGMAVLEAADGLTGLETARTRTSGCRAARRDDARPRRLAGRRGAARGSRYRSSIPIVFLTARAELRDRARGLDLGGLDYVTKPFNPVELAPLIRQVIARVEGGQREELRRSKLAELRER